jgi:putative ABC transport system permease protein
MASAADRRGPVLPPRWLKLLRDVRAERGRVALMVAAVAVSLAAVGAVLGARAILTREMAGAYLGTRPADATLELAGDVTPATVAAVRALPGVAEAEAREVVVARARVGEGWRRLLLFVVDDFGDLRLNRFRPVRGAWPPPDGAMLIERSAAGMLEADLGGRVLVKPPTGPVRAVEVAGVVHDPGLAPAWQERSGYGYVSRATLAALGEPPALHELRVAFAPAPATTAEAEARAAELAARLSARGQAVRELQVPPLREHPHQRQMATVLAMLLSFAGMALILSGVLVATALAALLARQVREIGVLKTLGATAGQVARLYAALVGAVGLAALALALPAGMLGARGLATTVSRLLNFDPGSLAVPHQVLLAVAAAGLAVPLLLAASPIARAARRTVREALDDHGVAAYDPRAVLAVTAALPRPLREPARRPARLALTVGLLAVGVAMALTAIQVKDGWEANVAKVYTTRSYDTEVLLNAPAPAALADRLAALPGVRAAEAWGYVPAALGRPGEIDVVRTYQDRGHGSLVAMGPPPGTALVSFPLRAGRWLEEADRGGDAVVLNHVAAAQLPGIRLGDAVHLSLGGRLTGWRLVGIVEEIGAAGVAYVSDASLARATGTAGQARLLRVATSADGPERARARAGIEAALDAAGASVQSTLPLAELRTAMGDHVLVLVRVLLAMAGILGAVGALGLVSAVGVSVAERTRELAVRKTLGATPAAIRRLLLAEGLSVAALSYAAGWILAVPLTLLVDRIVGNLGFVAPLPLVLSAPAALATLAVGALVTTVATLLPARAAARLVIREALERT